MTTLHKNARHWKEQHAASHYNDTIHMVERVVVLRPARHKVGHFGDVPQANLLRWY